jgi:hypothetical protein
LFPPFTDEKTGMYHRIYVFRREPADDTKEVRY